MRQVTVSLPDVIYDQLQEMCLTLNNGRRTLALRPEQLIAMRIAYWIDLDRADEQPMTIAQALADPAGFVAGMEEL